MHGLVAAMLGLAAISGCNRSDSAAVRAESERLQGNWTIVAVERAGRPDYEAVGGFLTFDGEQVIYPPAADPAVPRQPAEILDGTR